MQGPYRGIAAGGQRAAARETQGTAHKGFHGKIEIYVEDRRILLTPVAGFLVVIRVDDDARDGGVRAEVSS